MKRLLLASMVLLALTGTQAAMAADIPPGVVYPALPPQPFTFTGFYVGGTVGGALGSSKYRETPTGTFIAAGPNVISNIAAVGTSSTAPRGVIGGAEIGYDWQVGHFVLGFETDFSGWDMSSSAGVVGVGYPGIPLQKIKGTAFTSTTSTNSNWLLTARPRVGFVNGNQLIYLTGGLAVSDVSFAQSIVLTGYGQRAGSGPTLVGATSSTQAGWTAGGGIEYALSWNWMIKAEYLYVRFPNQSIAQVDSAAPAATGTATGNLTASILRAGFDYRF
jgi:outer membrane immunogenic protein